MRYLISFRFLVKIWVIEDRQLGDGVSHAPHCQRKTIWQGWTTELWHQLRFLLCQCDRAGFHCSVCGGN